MVTITELHLPPLPGPPQITGQKVSSGEMRAQTPWLSSSEASEAPRYSAALFANETRCACSWPSTHFTGRGEKGGGAGEAAGKGGGCPPSPSSHSDHLKPAPPLIAPFEKLQTRGIFLYFFQSIKIVSVVTIPFWDKKNVHSTIAPFMASP